VPRGVEDEARHWRGEFVHETAEAVECQRLRAIRESLLWAGVNLYDDAIGSEVINALIKIHSYWIKETDVDGFRVDAIKHMGPLACSRFCSNIREYAYSLGKRGFFLFGELAVPNDDILDRYIGPNTSMGADRTVFFGIDSVLDFPLAEGKYDDPNHRPLRDVLKGFAGPETLFTRLEAQRLRALNRGEIGRFLVTFVDNHDGDPVHPVVLVDEPEQDRINEGSYEEDHDDVRIGPHDTDLPAYDSPHPGEELFHRPAPPAATPASFLRMISTITASGTSTIADMTSRPRRRIL